jgi:hypothetical protein
VVGELAALQLHVIVQLAVTHLTRDLVERAVDDRLGACAGEADQLADGTVREQEEAGRKGEQGDGELEEGAHGGIGCLGCSDRERLLHSGSSHQRSGAP